MLNSLREAWSPRIHFIAHGRKPCRARLPGLEVAVAGRYPNGKRIWRCCLDDLFSN